MFRTLYGRLMAVHMVVSMFMLAVLGIALSLYVKQQSMDNSARLLHTEAQEIVRLLENRSPQESDVPEDELFLYALSSASRRSNASVWVIGRSGQVLRLAPGEEAVRAQISQSELTVYVKRVLSGQEVAATGSFGGMFANPMLTVALPFRSGETVRGGVFLHAEVAGLRSEYLDLYWMLWFSTFCSFLLGALLTAIMSARIAKPLREIGEAAEAIAHGDFDRRIKADSDDEIGRLAHSFNAMAEELTRLDDLRKGFVANVSHELRSPLTSIHGFVQAMADGAVPEEDRMTYLNLVLSETRRLSKLISELLDLSQMDTGHFPLHVGTFELCELIRRVLIKFDVKIEERHLQISAQFDVDPLYVSADSDRIEQVVGNLLDNAIKFTPEYGEIRVWVHTEKGKVYVSVTDSGPGIPDADIPYIWDRFYMADKAHTPGSGTGLGLSIVRSIIEQHGQRVWAASPPGQGASFIFTLDRAPEKALHSRQTGKGGE